MITEQDITKLKKQFSTKAELYEVRDELKDDIGDLRVEVGDLRDRVCSVESKVDLVLIKLDSVAGAIHDIREDNAAGARIFYRHERNIQALAAGTGIILPES